jgi:2-polyprenyl-3-methyl-5-hydroxy-6-metoxy-1,4-benzoquinol methylase
MTATNPDDAGATNGRDCYRWVAQDCPICEKSKLSRLGRRGGAAHRAQAGVECEIWRCSGCGLVFPRPMPIPVNGIEQHYGMDADEYFEHHQQDEKGQSARYLLTQAEELVRGKGTLLDIGAGRGELLSVARDSGWDVTGIEPSARFAEYAASFSGLRVRREPLADCKFSDGSFDCVILSAVLEHLYDPDETIGEIARILRPNGVVFIDVPNEQGLYFKIGNLYQKLRGRDWVVNLAPTFSPFHVFGFSPRALRAMLSKHGLTPARWRVYSGRALVPARSGVVGVLEGIGANAVTALSDLFHAGTYIETWARKSK